MHRTQEALSAQTVPREATKTSLEVVCTRFGS